MFILEFINCIVEVFTKAAKDTDLIVDCPQCGKLSPGLKTENYAPTIKNSGRPVTLRSDASMIICKTCGFGWIASIFRADESGIMVVLTWDCPKCKIKVPHTISQCPQCGYE